MRIAIGSWNVAGVPPSDHSHISQWLIDTPRRSLRLIKGGDPNNGKGADIFVVGFQNIVPLNLGSVIKTSAEVIDEWREKLNKTLKKMGQYICLHTRVLVGLCIYVYVREDLLHHITELSSDEVGTGVLNVIGNKGAVGVRMKVFDASLCFVCCHLEDGCGEDGCKGRNKDQRDILHRMNFSPGGKIPDHEYVFWFGDLNYRLCGNDDKKTVSKLIKKNDFKTMAERDELTNARCTKEAFAGYNEGPLLFHPTYKYKLNSTQYDPDRIPAWCDRILWRHRGKDNGPEPLYQGSLMVYTRAELKTSDHRPIIGVLDILVEPTSGAQLNASQPMISHNETPAPPSFNTQPMDNEPMQPVVSYVSQDPLSLHDNQNGEAIIGRTPTLIQASYGGVYSPTGLNYTTVGNPQPVPADMPVSPIYDYTTHLYPSIQKPPAPAPPTASNTKREFSITHGTAEVNVADNLKKTGHPSISQEFIDTQGTYYTPQNHSHTATYTTNNPTQATYYTPQNHSQATTYTPHNPSQATTPSSGYPIMTFETPYNTQNPAGMTSGSAAYGGGMGSGSVTSAGGVEAREWLRQEYQGVTNQGWHTSKQMMMESHLIRAMMEYNLNDSD